MLALASQSERRVFEACECGVKRKIGAQEMRRTGSNRYLNFTRLTHRVTNSLLGTTWPVYLSRQWKYRRMASMTSQQMEKKRGLTSLMPLRAPNITRAPPCRCIVLPFVRVLYRPGDLPRATLDNQAHLDKKANTSIYVVHSTTLQCANGLVSEGKQVAVLNFASAKNPGRLLSGSVLMVVGGGFLRGSLAQEESLARASGLYHCLTMGHVSQFYSDNSRCKMCLYTHNIIYSPLVPVFRDDSTHELLAEPVLMSFISSPAVNARHAVERVGDPAHVLSVLEERMERVLAVAAINNHSHLVLGAWGCGVFANSTMSVALLWRKFLIEGKFKNTFESVYFAITDAALVKIFETVMDTSRPIESFEEYGCPQAAHTKNNRGGHGRQRGEGAGRRQGWKDANLNKHNPAPDDEF